MIKAPDHRVSCSETHRIGCLYLTLLLCMPFPALAAAPSWWSTYGVIDSTAEVDDYAVVNMGQLKTIIAKTSVYLDATLPGGAGAEITALLAAWSAPPAAGSGRDDFVAVNAGQLKTVAAIIYGRLRSEGRTIADPWTSIITDDDDYRLVNAGQVKTVFSFVVQDMDSDGDSYFDSVEIASGWNPQVDSRVGSGNGEAASSPGTISEPFAAPQLLVETKEKSLSRIGYRGFQTGLNRYRQETTVYKVWNSQSQNYDERTIVRETSLEGVNSLVSDNGPLVSPPGTLGEWDVTSDIKKTKDNEDWQDRGSEPVSSITVTLGLEYSKVMFQQNVLGGVPAFTGNMVPTTPVTHIGLHYLRWDDTGTQFTDFYRIRKAQYRWSVPANYPRPVIWIQVFIPDSGAAETQLKTWTPGGQQSPVYLIDPGADPRNGYYYINRATGDLDALTVRGVAATGVNAGNPLDETREDTVGAFVPVNDDDDDYDASNEADLKQTGGTARFPGGAWYGGVWYGGTDTDLLPVRLTGAGLGIVPGWKYQLQIPTHLKVWTNPDRTAQVLSGVPLPSTQSQLLLYVEGVAAGTGSLVLSLNDGQASVQVDSIKITAFQWDGPLNVPGYSKHRYIAGAGTDAQGQPLPPLPAGSQWIGPTGGRIMSTRTDVNDVEILWNSGPTVGLCNYYINKDYMWSREVNVVEVALTPGSGTLALGGPPYQGSIETVISSQQSSANSMKAEIEVASISGPLVAGQYRGEDKILLGFCQTVKVKALHGVYPGSPVVKRVHKIQDGKFHIDVVRGSAAPWYDNQGGARERSFVAVEKRNSNSQDDAQSFPRKFKMGDRPNVPVVDATEAVWGIEQRKVSRYNVLCQFECYFAVGTSDQRIDANRKATRRAMVKWQFDGSGIMTKNSGFYFWSPLPSSGLRPPSAVLQEEQVGTLVQDGDSGVLFDTSSPVANSILTQEPRFKWDPAP